MSLGLTSDMGGMLGNRKILITEGGMDTVVINKLSGILRAEGKTCLSDQIFLWTAASSTKTPMYAAFAIGQKWDSAVLLDSDESGLAAKKKIGEMLVKEQSTETDINFKTIMLKDAASIKKNEVAIEDLFPDEFFLNCVNEAYGLALKEENLPEDGSDMIATMVTTALKVRHNLTLDKKRVLTVIMNKFDTWNSIADLPEGTAKNAENLFKKINTAFDIVK